MNFRFSGIEKWPNRCNVEANRMNRNKNYGIFKCISIWKPSNHTHTLTPLQCNSNGVGCFCVERHFSSLELSLSKRYHSHLSTRFIYNLLRLFPFAPRIWFFISTSGRWSLAFKHMLILRLTIVFLNSICAVDCWIMYIIYI